MIVLRLRIVFDEDLNYFDTILRFKKIYDAEEGLSKINKNLNLAIMDWYKTKNEKEFNEYFSGFSCRYDEINEYYLVCLFFKT